jgi:hypothetical protein
MRIAEMLQAIANWLESPNNEAILLAEYDDACLQVVAESCVEAASALRKAADKVETIEPAEESKLTPEAIEDLATLATAFDESGDPELQKQASVIDELLLTIAAPPGLIADKKAAEEKKIDDLKRKYEEPRKSLEELNKIVESEKAIANSNMTKDYRVLEAPLNTRYCPDHAGVQIARIGEQLWQCELDKKTYNFATGFELANGSKVPGGDVSNQSQVNENLSQNVFDTREGRLNNRLASADNEDIKIALNELKSHAGWELLSEEEKSKMESDIVEALSVSAE